MKLYTSGRVKKLDARSIRIAITTEDVGILLGWSEEKVRRKTRDGTLVFTGDSIRDLQMLIEFAAKENPITRLMVTGLTSSST